jgi:predicted ester cyclase
VTSADLQPTIEDIFAEGDKVAVRWTFRGTYSGEPKPGYIPGERFAAAAISIYRFANGKIEEDWGVDGLWNTGIPWHNGS